MIIPRWRNKKTRKTVEQTPAFAEKGSRIINKLREFIVILLKVATMQDVAKLLNLSWQTVRDVFKRHLAAEHANPPLRKVHFIGIDELYLGRSLGYITIVMDLRSGRIIYVAKGRGGASLIGFWKKSKQAKMKIKAVAIDMSGAYHKSVRERLPHAVVTFDKFHVIKLMNERLDEVRRAVVREMKDEDAVKCIKGMKWILLNNEASLDDDQAARLDALLKANRKLSIAYIMKEGLQEIWCQGSLAKARKVLDRWIEDANASDIGALQRMAKTLQRFRDGILSYYKTKLTSARVEGINRKIRGLINDAYGIRDMEFFMLRLLGLHERNLKLI